jgi:hypothetical protein
MGNKQVGGPVITAVIVVVVLLVVGLGYFFLNKDHIGKEAEAKKAGMPGVVPPGADPKKGPFPSDTLPNGQKMPGLNPTGAPAKGEGTGG